MAVVVSLDPMTEVVAGKQWQTLWTPTKTDCRAQKTQVHSECSRSSDDPVQKHVHKPKVASRPLDVHDN